MYLRNAWYVDGLEHRLSGRKAGLARSAQRRGRHLPQARRRPRRASGSLRPPSGAAVAGSSGGDDLRCMYHGLKFAPSGKCIEIPGSPEKIPTAVRVKSFPVVERHSWVWVWPGDPALADGSLIPTAIGLDDPNWVLRARVTSTTRRTTRSSTTTCSISSHLSYVHPASFGADEQWARKTGEGDAARRGVRGRALDREPRSGFAGRPRSITGPITTFSFPGFCCWEARSIRPERRPRSMARRRRTRRSARRSRARGGHATDG